VGPTPGVHEHDGFFFRFGLGFASVKATGSDETNNDFEISGGGIAPAIMIGGTPAAGLVIGGAIVGYALPDPTFKANGTEAPTDSGSARLSTVGLFATFYPNPEQGLYFDVLLGYAEGDYEFEIAGYTQTSDTSTGYAIGAGVGYDFWVGEQWSLGPAFRIHYADLKYEDGSDKEEWSVLAPTLSFMVTLH
jgi:outer membrane autotransporter protein